MQNAEGRGYSYIRKPCLLLKAGMLLWFRVVWSGGNEYFA
ncbi:MAG: hypothetical protein AVDCRST_MAG03-1530 [uncultured Rubrobacteraceae bacterium]|uniref:Uncharacterized protein n=1 Tax=uncultured Rubrobacteraceae bacterium TaxID=349277 RepID=A0A6J4PBY6_9ACTN|nr:MAG: hypothetical protein AVDCRST_MAG03-1530 [uncultured Rubrobacteraceae bacterium]